MHATIVACDDVCLLPRTFTRTVSNTAEHKSSLDVYISHKNLKLCFGIKYAGSHLSAGINVLCTAIVPICCWTVRSSMTLSLEFLVEE